MIAKRKSGVSVAILALSAEKYESEFTIKLANTLEEREAVFKLAYQVYYERGFVCKKEEELLTFPYDTDEQTAILIVKDKEGNLAGTASLVFNANRPLPATSMYQEEIKQLEKTYKRNVEFCRFVIHPDYRNAKDILILLFNYTSIYITNVMKYDGLLIEVDPRHKNFHKRLLNFVEIGGLKQCTHAENAPSVLLYLSSEVAEKSLKNAHSNNILNKDTRSLYHQFIKPEQEEQQLVAQLLHKQSKPMTIEEKIYFGLIEADIAEAQLA